jgi:NADPH2:quinone reductase
VVVGAGQPHDLPGALGYEDAVALLADGRTAVMLVEAAGVQPGETALVEAAAGGVGTLLVQLLADAGAAVVAAAGGERKLALARELGAATAVDYRSPGWERAAGEVDVVFDGVGGETAAAAFTSLRRGGRMLSYGLASGAWADIPEDAAAACDVTLLRPRAQPEQMRGWVQRALDLAGAGRLRPVIGQRFALQDAAEAHRAVASRATVGKTVLLTRG